jgi:hypothetical protein
MSALSVVPVECGLIDGVGRRMDFFKKRLVPQDQQAGLVAFAARAAERLVNSRGKTRRRAGPDIIHFS